MKLSQPLLTVFGKQEITEQREWDSGEKTKGIAFQLYLQDPDH